MSFSIFVRYVRVGILIPVHYYTRRARCITRYREIRFVWGFIPNVFLAFGRTNNAKIQYEIHRREPSPTLTAYATSKNNTHA